MKLRTAKRPDWRRDGNQEVLLLPVFIEDLATGELTQVDGKFAVVATQMLERLNGGLVFTEETVSA